MKKLTFLCLLVSLTACGSIDGKRYLADPIDFDLYTFSNGDVEAWGIVQDRSGNLIQRFKVEIAGSLNYGELLLDETFSYSLGEGVEKRLWKINHEQTGFSGGAGDIVGSAAGKDYGNAFYWAYEMDLPVGDTVYRVNFEDWIWAFDDEVIVNRSYIKKFGVVFAEVTIFMRKRAFLKH
ncbi:MAG: DUF3833 family protein [Pseudomonadota bacterium]